MTYHIQRFARFTPGHRKRTLTYLTQAGKWSLDPRNARTFSSWLAATFIVALQGGTAVARLDRPNIYSI